MESRLWRRRRILATWVGNHLQPGNFTIFLNATPGYAGIAFSGICTADADGNLTVGARNWHNGLPNWHGLRALADSKVYVTEIDGHFLIQPRPKSMPQGHQDGRALDGPGVMFYRDGRVVLGNWENGALQPFPRSEFHAAEVPESTELSDEEPPRDYSSQSKSRPEFLSNVFIDDHWIQMYTDPGRPDLPGHGLDSGNTRWRLHFRRASLIYFRVAHGWRLWKMNKDGAEYELGDAKLVASSLYQFYSSTLKSTAPSTIKQMISHPSELTMEIIASILGRPEDRQVLGAGNGNGNGEQPDYLSDPLMHGY